MTPPSPTAETIKINPELALTMDHGSFDGPCVFVTLTEGREDKPPENWEYAGPQNLHLLELDRLIDALTRKRNELARWEGKAER